MTLSRGGGGDDAQGGVEEEDNPFADGWPGGNDFAPPTRAPVSAARRAAFREVLAAAMSGEEEALSDPSAPQRRALDWLADADADKAYPDAPRADGPREDVMQRYAPAVLYFATGGGDGGWREGCNFLRPVHECEWKASGEWNPPESVELEVKGVTECDSSSHVTKILLHENNLTGPIIPPEVGQLRAMEKMAFPGNRPRGRFAVFAVRPDEFGLDLAGMQRFERRSRPPPRETGRTSPRSIWGTII